MKRSGAGSLLGPSFCNPNPNPPLAQAGLAGLSDAQYDAVRGGAVVFLGTLARHLDPENPKARAGDLQSLERVLCASCSRGSIAAWLPPDPATRI